MAESIAHNDEEHEAQKDLASFMPSTPGRLKKLNKFLVFALIACIVFLSLSTFIPDRIGTFSIGWIATPLTAVLSAVLGAIVVMLIIDYHDIQKEMSYLQESLKTLLEMHQADDEWHYKQNVEDKRAKDRTMKNDHAY
ncbi:MAG: hypothetical protein FWE87_04590 [Coriobacteriia bacterium]|nr:hypothetical protein [Coriobacteriia bacterium]